MESIGFRAPRVAAGVLMALALLPLEAAAGTGGATAGAGPWVSNAQARVRLIAAAAGPGDRTGGLDLGLEFELEPGWHVYWKNSGDAGYPPRLAFSGSPALAGAELLFPAPRRYDLPGGLVSFGYEGQVIYPLSTRLPLTSGEKLPRVSARLDYLVCRMECIPHTAELAIDLESARQGTGPQAGPEAGPEALATAARLRAAREALPRDPQEVAGAPQVSIRAEPGPASSLLLVFSLSGGTLHSNAPDLFFESHPFFALERPELGRPELSVAGEGPTFRVPFRPLDETKPMPATTTFAWTLTGLERAPGTDAGETGGLPGAVALAGTASVEIPHLRTSETRPAEGLRPGLVLPLLVAGLFLGFFLIHRSRNRRS